MIDGLKKSKEENMNSDNAIFFTVKANNSDDEYYCMLMTALESLFTSTKNIKHDIIVFIDSADLQVNEINANGATIGDYFPSVKIIHKNWPESKYLNPIPLPDYFYKWLCLEYMVHNTNYKQIAYFDCDVFFLKDINDIFDCYPENFCGIYENYCDLKNKLIGKYYAMCSGQFIFEREKLINIPNILEKVIEKSNYLCANINKILDNHEKCYFFKTLMEQYAGHRVLLDYNIDITPMHTRDVCFGDGTCDIQIVDSDIEIINCMTRVVHYTRKNAALFVKSKYRNEKLREEFSRQVINNKLTRRLWG